MLNTRDFLKSELIKNTSVLVSGTILSQLVYLAIQPVVRRLYPVESFGIYSEYMSLTGMIAVISTLRYDDAIVLPAKDKDSANLLILSVLSGLLINAMFFILVTISINKIPTFLNIPDVFPISILYLVPAGALLINLYQGLSYWLMRKKKYTSISLNKLIRRSTEGATQVSLAVTGSKSGLIFSDFLGQTANVIASIIQAFRNSFSLKMISYVKLKYVAGKYSEFPKYNLIPAFMSTFSFLMPTLIITKFYSAENTGVFDACRTLLSLPLALVGTSMSSVLLQKTSERYNRKESITGDLRNVLIVGILISIAEIAAVMLIGPWFFKIYLGAGYEISGRLSRVLVWSFVLNFLIACFSSIFYSLRKIKVYSIWQVFYSIAIMSLFFLNHLEFREFLTVYVIIEVSCYLILFIIMFRMIREYERALIPVH